MWQHFGSNHTVSNMNCARRRRVPQLCGSQCDTKQLINHTHHLIEHHALWCYESGSVTVKERIKLFKAALFFHKLTDSSASPGTALFYRSPLPTQPVAQYRQNVTRGCHH